MKVEQKTWRKSSRCDSAACVEVAFLADGVAMRDSKDPGQHIVFSRAEWSSFVADLRQGQLSSK